MNRNTKWRGKKREPLKTAKRMRNGGDDEEEGEKEEMEETYRERESVR
jgi:hypothetical protein